MPEPDDVRYGVFLLPDSRTSAAVTTITTLLSAQFGFVSAGRFPPHMTLAGSLPLAVSETELVASVRTIAARHQPVTIVNAGSQRLWESVLAYDVHRDQTGAANTALVDLAVDVMEAVRPLLTARTHLTADVHDRADWYGHLSLASHDLAGRPEWLTLIEHFVHELAEPFPEHFEASRLGVFRLHHPDWTGTWWTSFTWELAELIQLGVDRAAPTLLS